MNSQQTIEFIDYLKKLWSEWKPYDEEVDLWCRQFSPYSFEVAKQAAGEHKFCDAGSYKTPKSAKVLELAKKFQQAKHHIDNKNVNTKPCIIYSVKCTDHRARHYIGTTKGFYIGKAKDLGGLSHDKILFEAAFRAKQAARLYGGEWIVQWSKEYAEVSNQ